MTIDPIFIIKFLASFLFYFIGGYLLYASLFAAIGALPSITKPIRNNS